MSAWLDEIFDALEATPSKTSVPSVPSVRAPPIRGAEEVDPAPDVILVLATDPLAGELTKTRAKLTDRTAGDRLGRLGSDGRTYADLELAIDEGEAVAARTLFAHGDLHLRWVVAGGFWFDVSAASGDLAVSSVEDLQWTVRLPREWLEQDRGLGELLAETEELSFAAPASSS